MKFTWILALVMAASSFALDTYECKDLADYDGKDTYHIVRIGTLNWVTSTEYDDKKVCERDAAQMEKQGNPLKKKAMPKDDESDDASGFVETLVGLMNEMKTEQGWRQSDGTLLWEKLSEGGYYCYDKNGMNAVKRVKEAKWCK